MKKALVCAAAAIACGALAACGGGKGAESPGTCPDGTVLKGSDCVPADSAGDTSGGGASASAGGGGSDDAPKKHHAKASDDDGSPAGGGGSTGGGSGSYDKDAVEAEVRRCAKQVKGNCGAATDEDGKANGPWGTVHASIVLGRNGHVKGVTIPDPYNGKPVGTCVSRELQKLVFPPYAGSSDATLEWDFEVLKPK